jgi:hypothetical protein
MADKKDDSFGSLELDEDVSPAPSVPPKGPSAWVPEKPPLAAGPRPAAAPAPKPPAPVAAAPAPPGAGRAAPDAAPPSSPEPVPSVGKLPLVPAPKAEEVCKHCKPAEAALTLLRPDMTPGQYLFVLLDNQLYEDAVGFLAHALPKREAVWWACQCVRSVPAACSPPKAVAAVEAAARWARDPNEGNRQATLPPAEALEFDTAAGCVALAALRSCGYYGPPPSKPVIPPNEWLTAQAVSEAVQTAVEEAGGDPAGHYRKCLALGIEVGNGTNRCK